MTHREKINTLRRLAEEATPGRWAILGTPTGYRMIAPAQTQKEADLKNEPNLSLMEAALNALTALLDVAEAACDLIGDSMSLPILADALETMGDTKRAALVRALERLGEGE